MWVCSALCSVLAMVSESVHDHRIHSEYARWWAEPEPSLCKKPEPNLLILNIWTLFMGETETCLKIQFMVARKTDSVLSLVKTLTKCFIVFVGVWLRHFDCAHWIMQPIENPSHCCAFSCCFPTLTAAILIPTPWRELDLILVPANKLLGSVCNYTSEWILPS